jgi:hypothetical protein
MRVLLWLALVTSTASSGLATTFFNGNFESPGTFPGPDARYLTYGDTYVTGWTHEVTDLGEFYTDGVTWGISAGEGTYYVGFGAFNNIGGTLSQTFDTIAGMTYNVNYLLTTQELTGTLPDQVALVEALDGFTLLASVTNTINQPAGVWTSGLQLSFTAASTSTTLRFTDMTLLANGTLINWGLDDVSVLESTPEPGTYALLALGLGFIALRRKTPIHV